MTCTELAPSTSWADTQDIEWQLIGPTGDAQVLDMEVDPNQSQRLYVATRNGIYRSTDGGTNWDQVLSGFFREVAVDPLNGDIVYAGPGVYKSTNGGDDWTLYNEGMTCTNVATMDVAKSNPNLLFTGSF
ncbi:MAG: hypothetical protein GY832_31130 [Chloroflexi bacterium]|nr:hypothetical protein [Chloroflexota bacterium]